MKLCDLWLPLCPPFWWTIQLTLHGKTNNWNIWCSSFNQRFTLSNLQFGSENTASLRSFWEEMVQCQSERWGILCWFFTSHMHPLVDSADAGLCLRVLHEPPSHGRDLAQVGGHATPAVLCGNQCAVLCDPMPTNNEFLHGVWTVIMFDFTQIWIDFAFMRLPSWLSAAVDKGLITQILFQSKIVSLSD